MKKKKDPPLLLLNKCAIHACHAYVCTCAIRHQILFSVSYSSTAYRGGAAATYHNRFDVVWFLFVEGETKGKASHMFIRFYFASQQLSNPASVLLLTRLCVVVWLGGAWFWYCWWSRCVCLRTSPFGRITPIPAYITAVFVVVHEVPVYDSGSKECSYLDLVHTEVEEFSATEFNDLIYDLVHTEYRDPYHAAVILEV